MNTTVLNETLKFLSFSVEDQVGTIILNREDKLNALNSEVLAELKKVLDEINSDKDFSVKGLIFTGAGDKSFIAGADISEMCDLTAEEAYKFSWLGQLVTTSFENLSIPVIACVNGFALGGGCEMAMACDFIYATENALFGQPEVKLGLIPGFGGTQRLARYIGRNYAKEIIYTGRNVDIKEACKLGLVVKSFSTKDEMISSATKCLKKMQKCSPLAISVAKEAINKGIDQTLDDALTVELDNFSKIFESEDMKEGTKAFVEKRKPKFTGR